MAEKSQIELLWEKVKERAERIINPISYSTFIEKLVPVDIRDKKLVLQALTDSTAERIHMSYTEQLREAIVSAEVGLNDFVIVVEGSEIYVLKDEGDESDDSDSFSAIDKRYTFDSYVVGSSNKFVFAAAKSVAEAPGENFNPLYIYGGSGLGKTHLMQAIANEILSRRPSTKVIYTTSEKFLNEYVYSMSAKRKIGQDSEAKFRNRYRNADVLLIDDIQFWAGKYGVQEAFFHTFNELCQHNKQIVISSDCPADQLETLEKRLRSRFEMGLIADIQPPDIETKIAILQRKALEKKCLVPDEVLAYLAKGSDNNVRTLEGKLNKVIFASKLREEPITLNLAVTALREAVDEAQESEKEALSPDSVIRATCTYYQITKEELIGKNKRAELVRARQICTYLMCEMLSLPLVSIGKEMGGKDHATVIYSRDKIAELMRVNDKVSKEVTDIKSIVLKQ